MAAFEWRIVSEKAVEERNLYFSPCWCHAKVLLAEIRSAFRALAKNLADGQTIRKGDVK